MARMRALLSLCCLAACSFSFATDRTVVVTWGTGQHVTAVISYPAGNNPAPTIVIASGRSGGMNTSIIKGFADKAVRDGLVAVRFDYTYFANKSEPSKGVVDEIDQMNAVINQISSDPRVDSKKMIIAGKSLGSVVAHRVFSQKNTFLGEILLTPLVLTVEDGNRLYPGLVTSGRPVVMVVGNQDTENAPMGVVYNFLKDSSRKVMLDTVAGDHGLELGAANTGAQKRANAANIDSALETAEYWVRMIARIIPPSPPTIKVLEKKKPGK